ncbi:MAG: hypothetical protein V4702_05210 [Patescibacteria group bacterium]
MDQTSTPTSGGSNAQDFQPPTQNPQGNVGGGLQPNSATNDSIFNQPSANQQALPQVSSLKVLSQGTRNSTPTVSPDTTSDGLGWSPFLIFFILAAAIIGILLWRAKSNRPVNIAPVPTEELKETIALQAKPKKKKKPKQKNKKKK